MKKFKFIEDLKKRFRKSEDSSESSVEIEEFDEIPPPPPENLNDVHFAENESELGPAEEIVSSKKSFQLPNLSKFSFKRKEKESSESQHYAIMQFFHRFQWNDFVVKLFSPYSRAKVHKSFLVIFIITFSWAIGKNIALFLNKNVTTTKVPRPTVKIPYIPEENKVQDINKIATTNLFNIKESDKVVGDKKKIKKNLMCFTADIPSNLPLKLVSTVVLQDSVKSVAAVQVRDAAEIQEIREGEKINEMAEVWKINRLNMVIKNLETGDCELVASPDETPLAPVAMRIHSPKEGKKYLSNNPNIKSDGKRFNIKKKFRQQILTNMSEVLTQAKAIQMTNPDGSLSYKMTEIVPGSVYSLLNIQENDIITSINGKKIENVNELMNMLGKLNEIDHFEIGLKRNGGSENLEYNFEN